MATHRERGKAQAWPRRGEIYLTTLDPTVGHEIKKTRPAIIHQRAQRAPNALCALIIQNDVANEHAATTIVAPVTSTIRLPLSPVHVLLEAGRGTGLAVPSMALLNQIRTVDRRRLVKRLGKVDSATMQFIDEAIRISLDVS
jgi:mRNA interferase MazF